MLICDRALWILTTSLMFLTWRKSRSQNSTASLATALWPGQANTVSHHGDIPFEDINNSNTSYPEVFHVAAPVEPWDRPLPPSEETRQQIIPDASDEERSAQTSKEIERDPATNSAFNSSRKTANKLAPSIHQGSVDEGSGPPSDTHQIDWSERLSQHIANPSLRSSMSTGRRVRRWTMGE
jgi:hypothetical protein